MTARSVNRIRRSYITKTLLNIVFVLPVTVTDTFPTWNTNYYYKCVSVLPF